MTEMDWSLLLWKAADKWSKGNVKVGRERRLWDGTRVDLLTNYCACEIDWAHKWAEGIGQALWYSLNTSKKPVLILLVKDFDRESKYIYRAKMVCGVYDIEVWLVDCKKYKLLHHDGSFPLGPVMER